MAITSPVDIGHTSGPVGTSSTIAFTTTGAVPANGKIFVHVGWFGAGITLSSGSGGGLSWTVDSQVANGSDHEGLMWADAPAGLASSTTITATFSGSTADGRHIDGDYVTGAATGAAAARTSGTTGTTVWSSGSLTVPTGSILMGGCYNETGTSATNTPSGGNTEIHDELIAGDSSNTTCYQIGTGASIASSGTWSGAGTLAAIGVRFDPSVAGGSAPASQIWPIALAQARRFFPWPPLGFNLRGDYTVPGTVFTDSGSGTLTLTGTGVESHSHSNSPAGTITLGGSFVQAFSHSGSASGTITLAGTRVESQTGSNTASGTITLAGTRTESETHSNSASGTIVLGGTATEDYHAGGSSFNDSGTGTITLAGTFTQSLVATDSGTGTITLAGTSSESAAHTASRTGTVTLAGTSNEVWGHVDSGTGTITLAAGTVTESQAHVSSATGQLTLFGTSQEDFHGFIPEETTGIRRLKRRRWQPN